MKNAKTNEHPSVMAAKVLLKKRRKALRLELLNKLLAAAGLESLSISDMLANFRMRVENGKQKWLLGGLSASQQKASGKSKKAKKGACCSKTKTIPPEKKVIESKKACPTKSGCFNKMPEGVSGFCKIEVSKGFDAGEYNRRAMLHNAIVCMPDAARHPEEFIFLAGNGSWPDSYRGIEVISNEHFSGVILGPKKFTVEA